VAVATDEAAAAGGLPVGTGLVLDTAGVGSIAVAGTDYVAPAGTAKVVIDLTGNTVDVPLTIKNGKQLGGITAQVTGTAATGFILRDSAGTQKGVLGYAVAGNEWVTGSVSDSIVLSSATSMTIDGAGASGVTVRNGTGGGKLGINSGAGTVLSFSTNQLTIDGSRSTFAGPLAFSASTSLSAVALQVAGDPDTGNGAPGGANTYDMIAGGVSAIRAVADAATADTEVNMVVSRNVGAAFTLQRVSMGAADSGGTGFKLLRVPN